jgi:hypothetical protein
MKKSALRAVPPEPSRLCVSRVYVEAVQVWFHCPVCDTALEGFLTDPRAQRDVVCNDCGATFDIPARAELVIT